MSSVIQHNTDYPVQALRDKMSSQSLVALAGGILELLATKHTELDTRLSNEITSFKADVADDVAALTTLVQQAKDAAEILGSVELGQIEDILLRLVNAEAIQKAIGQVNITLGGTQYQLASVVAALAMAERETKGVVLYNAAGTDVVGYRMELSNGQVVLFDVTKSESEDGAMLTATFSSTDYAGVAASFAAVYARRAQQLQALGSTLDVVTYDHVSRTHLVIDLTDRYLAGVSSPNPVTDENGDGQVGTGSGN